MVGFDSGERHDARRVLAGMISRCRNPKDDAWKYYGGRGIDIYEGWVGGAGDGYEAFIAHVGPRPSPDHQIDRIDGDKGYFPGNVRWVTPLEQMRNRRNAVMVEWRGETKSVSEWAEELGFNAGSLHGRIRRGWDIERAMTTPMGASAKKEKTPSRTMLTLVCVECGAEFQREAWKERQRQKRTSKGPFCSNSCSAKSNTGKRGSYKPRYSGFSDPRFLELWKARTGRVGECLVWKGTTATVRVGGVQYKVLEAGWYMGGGDPIPENMVVRSVCSTKGCIEVSHLTLTPSMNGEFYPDEPGRGVPPVAPKDADT